MADLSKALAFLESEEGQESIRKYWEEKEIQEKIHSERVESIYQKNKDNMVVFIEKILNKYSSDAYVNREYKLGYEPREDMLWVLKAIAEKYGEEIKPTKKDSHKWRKYLNMFTSEAYVYNGYFIQVMNGQGSVVKAEKIDNSPGAMRKWRADEKAFKKRMEELKNNGYE